MDSNVAGSGIEGTGPEAALADDLVLVSNRQPYRHRYANGDSGDVEVDTPAGGLAMGIDPVMQRLEGTWVAWGDGDADFDVAEGGRVAVPPSDPAYTLQRVRLSEEQVRGYYDGYANQALWPLCHTSTCRVRFEADHWECYREVNAAFADAVVDRADGDATVWFQDYHLALAPVLVREREPDAFLMHFWHIPWPAPDVFRICPQADALLEGILGNDLLGFHHPRYVAQFLECVDRLLEGAAIDWTAGSVEYGNRTTWVQAFPFGVDAAAIEETTRSADEGFWRRFRETHGIDAETTVAVGVDRLDYTKGIPERLDAIERLFETRPDRRGDLTYVQKGCGTRERIPAYQRYRDRVEERIVALNERFGTDDWSPVVYTTEMYDRADLFSLYRNSDVAIVGPLRDGMNLVAKEYVAAQVDEEGVLLLGPLAGAYEELGDLALDFDPYDTAAAADALERAVEMGPGERHARMRILRQQVRDHDLSWWLSEVLETAGELRSRRGEPHVRAE